MKEELKITEELKEVLNKLVESQVRASFWVKEVDFLMTKLKLISLEKSIPDFLWETDNQGRIINVWKIANLSEDELKEIDNAHTKVRDGLMKNYKINQMIKPEPSILNQNGNTSTSPTT
jgi:hypothetical protein